MFILRSFDSVWNSAGDAFLHLLRFLFSDYLLLPAVDLFSPSSSLPLSGSSSLLLCLPFHQPSQTDEEEEAEEWALMSLNACFNVTGTGGGGGRALDEGEIAYLLLGC